MESDDEVEPYDGSYACGFCSESVRGTALECASFGTAAASDIIDLREMW